MNNVNEKTIFVSIWGYSMIMVDFWRVKKICKETIVVERLKTKEEDDGFLTGYATPLNELETGQLAEEVRIYKNIENRFFSRKGGMYKMFEIWNEKPVRYDHCD